MVWVLEREGKGKEKKKEKEKKKKKLVKSAKSCFAFSNLSRSLRAGNHGDNGGGGGDDDMVRKRRMGAGLGR